MVKSRAIAAVMLALAGLVSPRAMAAKDVRVVELALPRPASPHEMVVLLVQAGILPRGATIDVTRPDGALIGTVSPYAVHGQPAGTYTIPLERDAIQNGRVTVQLAMREGGRSARAPSAQEVTDLRLEFIRTGQ